MVEQTDHMHVCAQGYWRVYLVCVNSEWRIIMNPVTPGSLTSSSQIARTVHADPTIVLQLILQSGLKVVSAPKDVMINVLGATPA